MMAVKEIRLSKKNKQKVRALTAYCFCNVNNEKEITLETNMQDIGDSLDLLYLTQELEKEMEIFIPYSQVERIKTFGDLCNVVQDALNK